MSDRVIEVCVADAASLMAAVAGGADRIELCAALELGGLTPAPGMIAMAARLSVPSYAMIRPRGGDFVYSEDDVAIMLSDISAARDAGLAGVVLGANLPDGRLDVPLLRRLVAASAGLGLTLHRCFDLVPDPERALEEAIDLGFERILTSGGARNALAGADGLARAHRVAAGRIGIMAGSGVNATTAKTIAARVALTEWHGSCSVPVTAICDGGTEGPAMFAPTRQVTDAGLVRALRAAVS